MEQCRDEEFSLLLKLHELVELLAGRPAGKRASVIVQIRSVVMNKRPTSFSQRPLLFVSMHFIWGYA